MNNQYSTDDFYFAAFMMHSNFILVNHYKQNGKTIFVFDTRKGLNSLDEKYYQMQASIEPISYASKIRILKSLIHGSSYKSTYKELNNNVNHKARNTRTT